MGSAILLLLLVGLHLGSLGLRPLMDPDEGRYLEIPREMVASGDFVTPRLNGVLYYEKPPLHYWLTAGAICLFGTGPVAARLPGALFSLIGLAGVLLLGRSMKGSRAGWLAAVILGSSPLFLALARVALIDMVLAVLVEWSLICFWMAHQPDGTGRSPACSRWWWRAAFAFAALAMLAKGLIAIVLPGCIVVIYLTLSRSWRVLRSVPWSSSLGVFLAIAAPWHIIIALRDPEQLWFYFVREHFLRYTTAIAAREQPPYIFIPIILFGILPWAALVPRCARSSWAALISCLKRFSRSSRDDRMLLPDERALTFLASWILFTFVFFSISRSKLIPYILPLLPPLAVALGLEIEAWWTRAAESSRRPFPEFWAAGLIALASALALLAGAAGWISSFAPGRTQAIGLVAAGGLAALAAIGTVLSSRRIALAVALCGASSMALYAGIEVASPIIAADKHESQQMVRWLEEQLEPGDAIYSFGYYPQSIPPGLRRTIGVAAYTGELAYGISRLSPQERTRRFPSAEEFAAIWSSDQPVYLVLDRPSKELFLSVADGDHPEFSTDFYEIHLNPSARARREDH